VDPDGPVLGPGGKVGVDMRRRDFVTLLGTAVAHPVVARGQADRMRRLGVLMSNPSGHEEALARIKALEFGLLKLGLAQGRNLVIDYRFNVSRPAEVESAVSDVLGLGPDAILAHTPATLAALQRATRTVPVIFVQASDPVALGLVGNLARPEANITGFVLFEPSLGGKWLQLLHDVAPGVSEALIMHEEDNPSSAGFVQSIETVAPKNGTNR
jgi:putative ABC transport system substrate-binding protein